MNENFKIHTPKSEVIKKGFLIVFLFLIGLFIALFLWKFVEALITLRYGDSTEKQALQERAGASFTLSPELNAKKSATNSAIEATQLVRTHNPVVGTNTAPIHLVAFIDFECPYCQKSYPVLKEIMEQYDGVVQVIFKHFPLQTLHPDSVKAAIASTCAQEQGKFWEYFDILFEQKKFDANSLMTFAETLELNTESFLLCVNAEKYKQNIAQDLQDGLTIGIRGTPTFILEDQKIEGTLPKNTWDQLILKTLQKKTSNL